jgi:hypothetical protein
VITLSDFHCSTKICIRFLLLLPKRERALRVDCRTTFHIFANSKIGIRRFTVLRPCRPARVQVDLLHRRRVVEKVRAVGRGRVERAVVNQGCVQISPQHHGVPVQVKNYNAITKDIKTV